MTGTDAAVLVVEDDVAMRRVLVTALRTSAYTVIEAGTGREAAAQAAGRNPDVILLDLGLPDADGVDLTRKLRTLTRAPIIVISARGREHDKVAALDAGADDYLTKPFGTVELLARIRVALRHARAADRGSEDAAFAAHGVRVDLTARRVFANGREVHLTPTEYKLLAVLVRHPGRVMTHRQLLELVWGPSYVSQTQNLRVYMGQLRHKLEHDPARPRLLTTEPGVGYRLDGE